MRRLPLPSSASVPYQLRQTLFCYAHRSSPSLAPQWLLWSRHDRVRSYSTPPAVDGQGEDSITTTTTTTTTTTSSSSSTTISGRSTRSDGQNHDRDTGHQDKDRTIPALPRLPYKFETGISLFAKRAPRPFPPPFLSPPSGSFSDPLSTHHRSRDRRPKVNGELIKGWTNGDDAAFASEYFIGANDGVGAWSARPRGHAGYVQCNLGALGGLLLTSPVWHHADSRSPPACGRDSSCTSGPPP